MKSLRSRSAIIASIASMLIGTMLLGSVLISNVYAKGSGSEKSKYNLDENCKDDHKGKLDYTNGNEDTDTEQNDTNEIDNDEKQIRMAEREIHRSVGIMNPEVRFLDPFWRWIMIKDKSALEHATMI